MRRVFDCCLVGGGPAGAALATHLAREGWSVVLFDDATARRGPNELLSPATLRPLLRLGIDPWDQLSATPCEGVDSIWSEAEPEYFDYRLFGCMPGAFVDRLRFRERLATVAETAGVRLLREYRVFNVNRFSEHSMVYAQRGAHSLMVEARYVVLATGCTPSTLNAVEPKRRYDDDLVALYAVAERRSARSELLIEAQADGWWYVTHGDDGSVHVVFMTDGDLVPKGKSERAVWLARRFGKTRIAEIVGDPNFQAHRGCGARTGWVSQGALLSLGDAAWSNDPLSGSGLANALESAEVLSRALVAARVGDYVAWAAHRRTRMRENRLATYEKGPSEFRSAPFWSRRHSHRRARTDG